MISKTLFIFVVLFLIVGIPIIALYIVARYGGKAKVLPSVMAVLIYYYILAQFIIPLI